jgi:DNA gyrase subunit A
MTSNNWRERLAVLDLSPEARTLVEELLTENERLRSHIEASTPSRIREAPRESSGLRPSTLETRQFVETRVLVTISAAGHAKRTSLNSYGRQRRGGMGIYDIRTRDDDSAHLVTVADADDFLLLLTQTGRAFRVAVADLPLTEPRGRGVELSTLADLANEQIAAVLSLSEADLQRYVLFASQTGFIKRMRAHYFGPALKPGTVVMDPRQTGGPAEAMCLSIGTADVLMVSRGGMATRFNISTAPLNASPGIKLRAGDRLAGVAAVHEEDAVFLATEDGLGTRRLMEGFTANKAPGAAGKIIMKSEAVTAVTVAPDPAELVCLTAFAKIIRFSADEIPAKTAPVQGVDVVDVRGDRVVAAVLLRD